MNAKVKFTINQMNCNQFAVFFLLSRAHEKSKQSESIEFIEIILFFCIVGTSRISGALLYPLYLFLAIVCSLKAHCIVHGVTHRTEEEFKKKHTMIGCTWQI